MLFQLYRHIGVGARRPAGAGAQLVVRILVRHAPMSKETETFTIDGARYHSVKRVFQQLLELPKHERWASLASCVGDDPELQREVALLLAKHDSSQRTATLLAQGRESWADKGDLLPLSIGRYPVDEEIGRGAVGVVYRCHDERLNRAVAVKLLRPELLNSPTRWRYLAREARVLASINHSNVATIFSFEESKSHAFLVMECVDGETLDSYLKLAGGALPFKEALRIVDQIAFALAAAHEKGVVHRDLKPGNVMVRPDGQVKVLDFGIAVLAVDHEGEAAQNDTIGRAVAGTPGYMSPEQMRGDVDVRADIYALGCILFECLSGTAVNPGTSPVDRLAATIMAEPDWSALPPNTPVRLKELLSGCLSKDPATRVDNVAKVRHVIAECLGTYHLAHGRQGDRRSVLVSAIGMTAATTVVGWSLWLSVSESPTRLQIAPVSPVQSVGPPAGSVGSEKGGVSGAGTAAPADSVDASGDGPRMHEQGAI